MFKGTKDQNSTKKGNKKTPNSQTIDPNTQKKHNPWKHPFLGQQNKGLAPLCCLAAMHMADPPGPEKSAVLGLEYALLCIYGEYWLRLKSNHKNTYLRHIRKHLSKFLLVSACF